MTIETREHVVKLDGDMWGASVAEDEGGGDLLRLDALSHAEFARDGELARFGSLVEGGG
jgi:hypothetical protein